MPPGHFAEAEHCATVVDVANHLLVETSLHDNDRAMLITHERMVTAPWRDSQPRRDVPAVLLGVANDVEVELFVELRQEFGLGAHDDPSVNLWTW